jgi:predicted naringenin-chalcone synthase
MALSTDHLWASYEVYRAHGNSSSPTVLIVLDRLRRKESERRQVVLTAFGPGLAIEMAVLERY